jgi:hypothetical protein
MKSYPLFVPIRQKLLVLGILLLLTLLVPAMYLRGLRAQATDAGPPGFILLPWLLIMGWNWWVVLTLPHEIRLSEDGRIAFVSVLRTVTVGVPDLLSIRPIAFSTGFYTIRHRGGRLRVLLQFDGFHDFLTRVKGMNPSLQVRGC